MYSGRGNSCGIKLSVFGASENRVPVLTPSSTSQIKGLSFLISKLQIIERTSFRAIYLID